MTPIQKRTILAIMLPSVAAFAPHIATHTTTKPLFYRDPDEFAVEAGHEGDLRHLLTQRALQSFVFTLNQCRQKPVVDYLEKQLNFSKLEDYHGIRALNATLFPEWDTFLTDLAQQEKQTIVLEVTETRRRRTTTNYMETISKPASESNPPKGATDIPSKRWTPTNYLHCLNQSNRQPTRLMMTTSSRGQNSYAPNQPQRSMTVMAVADAVMSTTSPSPKSDLKRRGPAGSYLNSLSSNVVQPAEEDKFDIHELNRRIMKDEVRQVAEYEIDIDPSSLVSRILSVREQIADEWKEDLVTLIRTNSQVLDEFKEKASNMTSDVKITNKDLNLTSWVPKYDHSANTYLTNSIASKNRGASPFRRANFDLLLLLCTEESVLRVLQKYKEGKESSERYQMLHGFHKAKAQEFFHGHQKGRGQADLFLQSLLTVPSVVTKSGVVHPLAVAEDIVRARSVVAKEWKSVVNVAATEHLSVQRVVYTKQMSKLGGWSIDAVKSTGVDGTPEQDGHADSSGAFQ